jgi:hypothetical protein
MPIFDMDLQDISTTYFTIKAVMLYPESAEEQQIYVRLHQELYATQKPGQGATGPATLDRALFKDLYGRKVSDMQTRHDQGRLAGAILVLIKQLQDHGIEEGVNKAIHMLIHWHKAGDLVCPIPTGRTSLQHYWSHFKPVAHLWADVYLHTRHVICPQPHLQTSREQIMAFLARAEWFQRFGEQHIPKRSNPPVPTLPPEHLWRVPAEVPLPVVDLQLPRLTGHQRACLQTYLNPNLYFKQSKPVR